VLVNFGEANGAYPYAGLVQDLDGKLYGTASFAGANGDGTVFEITPAGVLTTLHNFDYSDGDYPYGNLVLGADRNLYATTSLGGINGFGYGTVFKMTPTGTLTTLYSFCAQTGCTDGIQPYAGLVQAADGNFYGTTHEGGANGYGTVFKITPTGTLTTLHSFCAQINCADGSQPIASLVQSTDVNFYGTTPFNGANGYGTVFKITPTGTLTTLYSFCARTNCSDGGSPSALVQGTDRNFYGTTSSGGANYSGTVFKITPTGTLTTLYSFCAQTNCTDGSYPSAGLVQATDGNFYGTTAGGGANGYGTVFRITPQGSLTTLHTFRASDGGPTLTSLVQATNGIFYGTNYYGGTNDSCHYDRGCGTVFGLGAGLGPFVETQPAAAAVGKRVRILGNSLKGATSVTFNGTAAAFTVESPSLIRATVPAGATTGTVQVVTLGGTLSSNVPFRVIQ
jgi:uncharacterized repeat protein (TIGR03803 family)